MQAERRVTSDSRHAPLPVEGGLPHDLRQGPIPDGGQPQIRELELSDSGQAQLLDGGHPQMRELELALAAMTRRAEISEDVAAAANARCEMLEERLEEQREIEEGLRAHISELEAAAATGSALTHEDAASAPEDSHSHLHEQDEEEAQGQDKEVEEGGAEFQWWWFDTARKRWNAYDSETAAQLTAAHVAGQITVEITITKRTGGTQKRVDKYRINLATMEQINIATNRKRSIRCARGQPPAEGAADSEAPDVFLKRLPALVLQKDASAILTGLSTHKSHRPSAAKALAALIGMAAIGDSMRTKLTKLLIVPRIVAAMAAHATDAFVQERGCRALRRMSWSRGGCVQMAECGVGVVVECLQTHRTHARVVYEACAVLRIICNNADCRRVVLAWRSHHDAGTVGRGKMTPRGAENDGPEADIQVGRAGEGEVIGVVLDVLREHIGNADVCAQATGALRFCCLSAGMPLLGAQGGGVDLVRNMLAGRQSSDGSKWGKQLLELLSDAQTAEAARQKRDADALSRACRAADEGRMGELCRLLAAAHADEKIRRSCLRVSVRNGVKEEGQGSAAEGGGQAAHSDSKYVARKLVLETSAIAAAGLKQALGLEDRLLGNMLQEPEVAIECEILRHGTWEDKDNFYYIQKGCAQKWEHIPEHVKEDIRRGMYHGGVLNEGDYDAGHAGWTLDDFVRHEHSALANLKRHHVLALRLYTSDTYRRLNGPLRELTGVHDRPHPFRFTVYVLMEALKLLRVVEAKLNPADFNCVKFLYRGMANMVLETSGPFLQQGGTELAMMSTTDQEEVAKAYASSRSPLIFRFRTTGLDRGCKIQYLSLYPKETEYLYPPLTFVRAEGEVYSKDGYQWLDVMPQMS